MVPEDWRIQHFCIIRLSFGFPFRHCKSSIGTESRSNEKKGCTITARATSFSAGYNFTKAKILDDWLRHTRPVIEPNRRPVINRLSKCFLLNTCPFRMPGDAPLHPEARQPFAQRSGLTAIPCHMVTSHSGSPERPGNIER